MVELLNIDCMEMMPRYQDNHFDLAIVDPPYGLSFAKTYTNRTHKDRLGLRHKSKDWDDAMPTDAYFEELFRVSNNQIIWGGNYFPRLWGKGCKGFIFWYKQNPVDNFSDGELAWTSFNRPVKAFDYRYYGNLSGNTSANSKIHPTQKPIELYEWLLINYAKTGDKILDTHLGSGSIALACHNYGFDLVGCEIDKEYYDDMMIRYNNRIAQQDLFTYDDIYRN